MGHTENDCLDTTSDVPSSPISIARARLLTILPYVCGRLGHGQPRTLLCLRC